MEKDIVNGLQLFVVVVVRRRPSSSWSLSSWSSLLGDEDGD